MITLIKSIPRFLSILSKTREKIPLVSSGLIALAFVGLLFSSHSLAANDGRLGPSSSGSINISVTVPNSVQINQLQDIQAVLNQQDSIQAANGKLQTIDACVYSTSGAYRLNVQNSNGIQNGTGVLRGTQYSLPYQLSVADNHGSRYESILGSSAKVEMKGANNLNCTDGKNLHIQMLLANNAQLLPDHYSDVVSLTVYPV